MNIEKLTESKADQEAFKNYLGDDAEEYLKSFDAIKSRIEPKLRDIYWWIKNKPAQEFKDFINSTLEARSNNEIKKSDKHSGSKQIYNHNGWFIYRIDTYKAAQFYGRNTKWCICGNYAGHEERGKEYFDEYKEDLNCDYYFIIHGNDKWCYLDIKKASADAFDLSKAFWAADDTSVSLTTHSIKKLGIPQEVLEALPGFNDNVIDTDKYGELTITKEFLANHENIGASYKEFTEEIIVEEGVEHIPAVLFYNFHSLKTVKLPSTLKTIGNSAFANSSIETITIPASVEAIGREAFGNSKIQSVIFEEGSQLAELGASLFYNCSSLQEIKNMPNVERIGVACFENCDRLESIAIPDTVDEIDCYAFNTCGHLRNVKISKESSCLMHIRRWAFGNTNLPQFIFPDALLSIEDFAFYGCNFRTVDMRDTCLRYIGAKIFDNNVDLKTIILPSESIDEVSNQCFDHSDWNYRKRATVPNIVVWDYEVSPEYEKLFSNWGIRAARKKVSESLLESKADKFKFINWFGTDDIDKSIECVDLFDAYKNRMPVEQRDMYWWMKNSTPEDLRNYLAELRNSKSNKELKYEAKSGATTIYDKDGWKILRIDTYNAAQLYGKGTKWCISGNYSGFESQGLHYFDKYKEELGCVYYFIIGPQDKKWCYLDVPDKNFNNSSSDYFWTASDTGLKLNSLDIPKEIPQEVLSALPNFDKRFTKIEIDVNSVRNFKYHGQRVEDYIKPYIETITVSEEIEEIDDNAFRRCTNLTNVFIPGNIKYIGASAFSSCINLESVVLSEGLERIDWSAFEATAITEIVIPASVEVIGQRAFYDCVKLTKVVLKDGPKDLFIEHSAFARCISIKEFNIPNRTVQLDDAIFESCDSLQSIKLSKRIDRITNRMFRGCASLRYFEIPDNITTIGSSAFSDCINLEIVVMPHSVKAIDMRAFWYCVKLNHIYYNGSKYEWDAITGHNRVINGRTNLHCFTNDKTGKADFEGVITESLLEAKSDKQRFINYLGANGEKYLQLFDLNKQRFDDYKLRDYYWWISNKSADECKQAIDGLVASKSKSALKHEEKEGAKRIYAKAGWKIYRIDTYDAAKYYGKGTRWCICGNYDGHEEQGAHYFEDYKKRLNCDYYFIISPSDEKWCYLSVGNDVYSTDEDIFFWDAADQGRPLDSDGIPENIPKEVLFALPHFKDRFKDYSLLNFDDYYIYTGQVLSTTERHKITRVKVDDSVEAIPSLTFRECSKLTTVVFGENSKLKTIGKHAFYECSRLKEINLPKSLEYIDNKAFKNCISLLHIIIPDTTRYIGKYAFGGCASLLTADVGNGLETLDIGAFFGCEDLYEVTFGNSELDIQEDAFFGCKSLVSIRMPSDIKYLGDNAFSNCDSLIKITLPDKILDVGANVFGECVSLKQIDYSGTKREFKDIAGDKNWLGLNVYVRCSDGWC